MNKEKLSLSDWLIASDIDGTLNNKARKLPKRNYDAIQKFVHEYSGNFILSSGRSIEAMRKHVEKLHLTNGYAVFINGAGVYNYTKEEIVWLSPINERIAGIIKNTAKKFSAVKLQIVTPEAVHLVKPDIPAYILAVSSLLKRITYKSVDEIPEGQWCKAIFTGLPPIVDKVEKYVTEVNGDSTNLMRTSPFSFEIVNENTNKGVAVLKVAEILGVDKSKTAAIGDYFNDYQMLKSVALPACCGQAPQGMKDIAKLVTCHCNKGAVADLIEYIIENHDNL